MAAFSTDWAGVSEGPGLHHQLSFPAMASFSTHPHLVSLFCNQKLLSHFPQVAFGMDLSPNGL